jgi:hypothetical protein
MLAETGSVIGACEAVGMSRKSAYRLRALPGAESFAAAWDAALGARLRKVTSAARDFFDCNPLVHMVTFRGQTAARGATRPTATCCRMSGSRLAPGQGHGCLPDGDSAPPQPRGIQAAAMASATIRTIRERR